MIILAVYVDNIVIAGSDSEDIELLKSYLNKHFHMKDLGLLLYFLGIEVARFKEGVCLSQRKYVLDLLDEIGLKGSKPVDTPMDSNVKFSKTEGEDFKDAERYRRLVGKLIYLTVTRPDIIFSVGVVNQFMQNPKLSHWEAVCRILRYLKGSPGKGLVLKPTNNLDIIGYSDANWAGDNLDRRSVSGFYVFVGGNLVSWKSKKQSVVARSSAEAEYRAMAHTTCELL